MRIADSVGIWDLPISTRTKNVLQNYGFKTAGEVRAMEARLSFYLGSKSFEQVCRALHLWPYVEQPSMQEIIEEIDARRLDAARA